MTYLLSHGDLAVVFNLIRGAHLAGQVDPYFSVLNALLASLSSALTPAGVEPDGLSRLRWWGVPIWRDDICLY